MHVLSKDSGGLNLRRAAAPILVTGVGLLLSGCPGGADLENVDHQIAEHSKVEGEYCDALAIFQSCGVYSGCHLPEDGAPLLGGVDLVTPGVAERMIDESPAYPGYPECALTQKLLIDSENPEESYLWQKINNTHVQGTCGDYMPLAGRSLDTLELNCVRVWMDWVIKGGDESGSGSGGE